MNLKDLLSDENAVSPVIGVILMVAITVILAAVIGTFVLGLGDQVQNTAPQASFTFDFNQDALSNDNEDELTITHDGGDKINNARGSVTADVNFRLGAGNDSSAGTAVTEATLNSDGGTHGGDPWVSGDATAGTSFTIVGEGDSGTDLNEGTVRVVWEGQSGDNTATLGKWTGPDA